MSKSKYSSVFIIAVLVSCALIFLSIPGCQKSVTSMSFSYSDFNSVKTREISIGSDTNKLDMSGKIKMGSGTVKVNVKTKDTGEALYSKEYTIGNCGEITIRIDDLGKNKNLVLELDGKDAKDFYLLLNSEQKLVSDCEIPSQPDKPKKSTEISRQSI